MKSEADTSKPVTQVSEEGVNPNRQSGNSPPPAGSGAGDGRDDASTSLLKLFETKVAVDLFTDRRGVAFARVEVGGVRQVHELRSEPFRQLLGRLSWKEQRRTVSDEQLSRVIGNLEGRARFEGGEPREVFVRVGLHEGEVYVDLGDPAWRAVRINKEGWSVVNDVPVLFRRPIGFGALPAPECGGSVRDLRQLLNLKEDWQFELVVGFLVGALNPAGPYPVLELTGEQGAAKSTTARMLKSLIDPGAADSRTVPRREHDLAIAAHSAWMLSFDNMSVLSEQMSDAMCRMSTGGSFTTRRLYTDDGEQVFSYKRPVIVNGINGVALRADLLERTLSIQLAPIPASARKTEGEIMKQFASIHPSVLGALCDAVVSALARKDSLPTSELPRLADLAQWVTAAEPALGWHPGTFLAAMKANGSRSSERALDEYEGLVVALASLTSSSASRVWTGTASELRNILSGAELWWLPRGANQLSGLLRRLQAPLREAGFELIFDREGARRYIIVRRRPGMELPQAA